MVLTKKDLNEVTDTLQESFRDMLTKSIDELKSTIIESLKQSNEILQMKFKALEAEVVALKKDQVEYVKQAESSFQHGRLEQIIVSGIPESVSHEELENKCCSILNNIKSFQIGQRDIAACHRMGKKGDTILRFVNRKDAEDCLVNKKKLQDFDLESVGFTSDTQIFISENLSPYMSRLAYYCRILKRKGVIRKLTTFKGVIKILKSNDTESRYNVIQHKEDLARIFPNLDDLLNL